MNIPGTGWLYTFSCFCHTVFLQSIKYLM